MFFAWRAAADGGFCRQRPGAGQHGKGNKYALYFLTFPNNNFRDLDEAGLTHSHVTFTDGGGVDVEMIDGHGLYFAVPGVFAVLCGWGAHGF